MLYQKIDENDKIYLDKDLNAIFNFVFQMKFMIDNTIFLINRYPRNEENKALLKANLTNYLGLPMSSKKVFPEIQTEMAVCDSKYKDDNDYIFIKKVYDDIKEGIQFLDNLIKGSDVETYVNKTYAVKK